VYCSLMAHQIVFAREIFPTGFTSMFALRGVTVYCSHMALQNGFGRVTFPTDCTKMFAFPKVRLGLMDLRGSFAGSPSSLGLFSFFFFFALGGLVLSRHRLVSDFIMMSLSHGYPA
jgi:hypothetical protein